MTRKTIFVKKQYGILGNFPSRNISEASFSVMVDEIEVNLVIQISKNLVETIHQFEVSEDMFNVLQTYITDGSELPQNQQDELMQINQPSSKATRILLTHIKYGLNYTSIRESLFSVKPLDLWSEDGEKWFNMPTIQDLTLEARIVFPLNEERIGIIQNNINNKKMPYYSLQFLHKAQQAIYPRDRLLYSAIAVELAIKEYLIEIKPKLDFLVLHIPSPPLEKMYHNVLESLGERPSSVRKKELQNLAEYRNKLVHRPQELHISHEIAKKIVTIASKAVYDLIRRQSPSDELVENIYQSLEFD